MKVTYSQEEAQANWKGISEHPGWLRRTSVTGEDTKAFPIPIALLTCTSQRRGDVQEKKLRRENNWKIKFSHVKIDRGG